MPYATGRTFFDADSHLMERPDFLREHADPDVRERLPLISVTSGGKLKDAYDELGRRRAHPPEKVEELLALGDGLIAGPKGYAALCAFSASERTQALDLLGFERQFVFATFSPGSFFPPDIDRAQAVNAATAHNRAMAEFCADDPRLIGV